VSSDEQSVQNLQIYLGEILADWYGWKFVLLPVLYSYCNWFFIRDGHGEFGSISVHLFDALPLSRKVGIFFRLESGNCVMLSFLHEQCAAAVCSWTDICFTAPFAFQDTLQTFTCDKCEIL